MRNLLLRWVINAVALWVAASVVPGVHNDGGWEVLFVVALIFGLVNALIRPLLTLLTCPLIILTLGLFTLVINAVMLWLASWLGRQAGLGFYVEGPWAAFLGALVVSIVSWVLSVFVRDERERRKKKDRHRRHDR